jgi:chromosome segregation ATPase
LAVNVATRTRELAAARIEEFNAKFQERTEAGARLAERVTLDQRISGLSPDSIPGMRERLASLQQQRNMAAESLGPAITLMQRTLLSTGIGSQATQEAIRAYWAVADGLKGFDADLAELGRQLAQTQRYQPTDVRLALAQLTRDTSDDLAALREQEKLLTEDLNALDPNDPRNADAIIDLAGRLAGVQSSVESLDQTIQDRDQREQDLADLLRQVRDNQDRILAVATGESDRLLAFLTGAMNGSIGGRVGLGAQTPFYAGAGPRY